MAKEKSYQSVSGHSLDNLKHYHNEATNFFAAELMMLKEVIPKITDERQTKAVLLLTSCIQTGAAILKLANETESFTTESIMLSRAFMEKITNFCYVSICDEKEYRAFILHPIYKHYHSIDSLKREDDFDFERSGKILKVNFEEAWKAKRKKQKKLKENPIVEEALHVFSDKNPNLNWTKKNLNQRIEVLERWGKFLDVVFRLSKIEYYSDASEALHGSLYGCGYGIGAFDPDFDRDKDGELDKKLYKDSACNLLQLGMLIHETLTLISYSTDIKAIQEHSYKNNGVALNLHFYIIEKKFPLIKRGSGESLRQDRME